MGRIIGISHRTKFTVQGEARPTLVAVCSEGVGTIHELETEDNELDFVHGRFPVSYRDLAPGETVGGHPLHHLKLRKLKKEEDPKGFPEDRIRLIDKVPHLITKVPEAYEGLGHDDRVAMILGGSGSRFAFALSRKGSEIGATVNCIPAHALKAKRGEVDTSNDHTLLAETYLTQPELFQEIGARDRTLIKLTEQYRFWEQLQQDRKASALRLRTQAIGRIFFSEEGYYPQGTVEEEYDRLSASDEVVKALIRKEGQAKKEMEAALSDIPVYTEVLSKVEGVGPSIAAGIIAAVGDIRRFKNKAKLKAFLGVHVLANGTFPRKRRGEVCNWSPEGRQALYKLYDQMNRRQESLWGKKLIGYKVKLREKHPEPIVGGHGKKKYTNGHIHKMAAWRTMTKFVEWLFKEWKRIERGTAQAEAGKQLDQAA